MLRQRSWMICLLGLVTANVSWAQDQPGKGKAGQDKTGQPAAGVGRSGQIGEPQKGKIDQPDQGVGRSGQVKDGRTDAGGPGRDQTRPSGHNSSATGDEQIAAVLLACNRNEVELAKFAKDRLKSEQAREFADMMIKDHQASIEKLEKLAGGAAAGSQERTTTGSATRSSRDPATARPDGATGRASTDATTTVRAGGRDLAGGQLDWIRIHREMANECLASSKAELERHEGEDFDKAYIGHQIGAHVGMVVQLKVLKNHASDKLAGQLDASLETATSHLDHARQIMGEQKSERSADQNSNRENRKESRKEKRTEKASD